MEDFTAAPAEMLHAIRPTSVAQVDEAVTHCFACPRLVAWREEVARVKRAAFKDQTYWGRPVPGFGPVDAELLIVGLAPAAHGANRTGRMFTGDRSGDVLYAALHAVGLANQPTATHATDGLELYGTRITAPVHCAPPDNKPTPDERDRCIAYLKTELQLIQPKAIVALGAFGWQVVHSLLGTKPRPKFGHGAHVAVDDIDVFASFHVSQQNTFTGKLTPAMLEAVLETAARRAGLPVG